MSRIEELIKELCPEGVERVKLGDCCAPIRKGTLDMRNLQENGKYPVFNSGKEITGYHSDYNNDCEAITIASRGEYAGCINYVNGKFWAGVLCYPYKLKEKQKNSLKYVFYILKDLESDIRHKLVSRGGIPAINKIDIENYAIPLPPLAVQREIVSLLDSFTTLIDKMKQEVEMRKRQMEYYREEMMTPKDNWETKTLGDIGNVRMCKRILRNQTSSNGPIPFYKIGTFGGVPDAFISNDLFIEYKTKYNFPKKGDILISAAGTIGRCVEYDGAPSYFQDSNIVWIENDESIVLNVYLRQFYRIAKWKIDDGGVVKRLYNENLKATAIPLPPLPVQRRIVATLDTFEAYITKLERLIALRQKQYEYYRERLLTFA